MLKCYRELEIYIYISGEVDTLNKTFKLSYRAKSSALTGRLFQIFTMRFPKSTFYHLHDCDVQTVY